MNDFQMDIEIPMGVEAVSRLQSVKRWHMVDTTRTQTVAEHSMNVAMLAYYIAASAPELYFGSPERIMPAAMFHDIQEAFMGDIPTQTKKYLKGLDVLEDVLVPREFRYYPNPDHEMLVKICDLADGIHFIEKYGVDRVAVFAANGLRTAMVNKMVEAKAKWPERVHAHVNDKIQAYLYI